MGRTTLSWDSGFCSSFLSFRTSIFNLYKMAEFTAEQIEVPAEPAADTGFSADQLEDFKEAFGLFDRVGDNQVAFNQVADICRALGQNPTNKEVAAILGNPTADDMANKRINFDACLPLPLQRWLQERGPQGASGPRAAQDDRKGPTETWT